MEIKNAIVRAENIRSLLLAIEELKEGRRVLAIKTLRPLTGLTIPELAKATSIACCEEPQGEVSEEAKEVGLLLKKFL